MNRTRSLAFLTIIAVVTAGCGDAKEQPKFPDLHPVKGIVVRGNQPVDGGSVRFTPDPDQSEFLINSEVGKDGTFSLTTVRTTDSNGERKPGAAARCYKVTYVPPVADQTVGGSFDPVELKAPVIVEAKSNDLKLELPKKKK